jgi:hypothetical protein
VIDFLDEEISAMTDFQIAAFGYGTFQVRQHRFAAPSQFLTRRFPLVKLCASELLNQARR